MYKCIESFKSKDGTTYYVNEQIDSIRYGLMTYWERWNFRQVLTPLDEDEARTLDFNSEKLDNEDSDDTPIFQQNDDGLTDCGGFGDGSGGGGGASGSWDNSNDSSNDDN